MATILNKQRVPVDTEYEKGLEIQIGINDESCGSQELTMGYTVIPPGARNPAHYHPYAEAGMFIVKGALKFYIGEERTETIAEAGSFVHVPKGEIHGLQNMSDTEPAALVFAYGNVPSKEASGTTFVEEPWMD